MHHSNRSSVVAVALASFTLPALLHAPLPPVPQAAETAYERWYDGLTNMEVDPARVAAVANVVIRRDVGQLTLTEGTLHFLLPVEGRMVGAIFVGKGTFSFAPPIEVERDQLRRHTDESQMMEPIKSAVLLFADSTAEELERQIAFGSAEPEKDARGALNQAMDYLADDGWFSSRIMTPLLNGQTTGLFYVHLRPEKGDPMAFSVNPIAAEEIWLGRKGKGRGDYMETLCQFHTIGEYQAGLTDASAEEDGLLRVKGYEIDATITSGLDFSAAATVNVTKADPDYRWFRFSLYSELEVDSVRHASGAAMPFYRPDESGSVWIDLGGERAASDPLSFTMFYEGDLIDRLGPSAGRRAGFKWMLYVKSSSGWYPRYGSNTTSFSVTFHTPKKYTLSSTGRRVSETVDDDVVTTKWEIADAWSAAFNLGELEEYRYGDSTHPVTLHIAEKAHKALRNAAGDAGMVMIQQENMHDMVGRDLVSSLAFYSDVFGPPPTPGILGTEIPYNHGQAFPGFVLLSWSTFQWTSDKGYDDAFRAHEVAHQWWGIGVEPASYHDTWLAEGLSEFSGLWYMSSVRFNPEIYFDRLEDKKKQILERRGEAAPIWLGRRVATSKNPGDYQIMVYDKGAWVFHMIRQFFLGDDVSDDSRFEAMLGDFYATYRGGRASTSDFEGMVSRHLGAPIDWFFAQYVYGSDIPTYRFAYKVDDAPNGEAVATVRVRQEDVSDDFKMIVPLLLDFGSEGTARMLILVTGPVTQVELPILPMKPKEIHFNHLEAVLADVKTEKW